MSDYLPNPSANSQLNEVAPLIFLDWAATAPLCEEAACAMAPYLACGVPGLAAGGGNANSLHGSGRVAFKALEAARRDIASAIGARPDEVIFTSGATEADNLALIGIVEGALQKQGFGLGLNKKPPQAAPSLVVSAIEHDAVLQSAERLRALGINVVMVKPNREGFITPAALEGVLETLENPLLVSVMAVNNETGAVMDVPALAKVAHRAGALFHTDATQALGKIPVSFRMWGVDALSLSSHKVGGPKGVGALLLKARTPFSAQMVGGGQESNRRSGTQNIAGVVGFAAALSAACNRLEHNSALMNSLRNRLFDGVVALPHVEAVVDIYKGNYAPHIVAITCKGFESETLILQLDKRGVGVSGGSACASASLEPSHVLSAMGIARQQALGLLRFSLGSSTTKEEVDAAILALQEVLDGHGNH